MTASSPVTAKSIGWWGFFFFLDNSNSGCKVARPESRVKIEAIRSLLRQASGRGGQYAPPL